MYNAHDILETIKMIEDDAKSNNFMTKEVHILNDDIKLMADTANKAQENNKKVIILVSTEEQKNKVFKLLKNAVKVDDLDNIVLKNGEVVYGGQVGTIAGIPVIATKATDKAYVMTKEAVKLFIKKDVEVEQDRDVETKTNTV